VPIQYSAPDAFDTAVERLYEEEHAMTVPTERPTPTIDDLVEEESLVEEVSIDGMCGVY